MSGIMNLKKSNLKIVQEFLNILEENGFLAYLIGGYVRDYLLKIESNDFDVVTNATPMELCQIFEQFDVKENYGSIDIFYRGIYIEVTTFRKESGYKDHRHPSVITYVKTIEEDLKRRDFTINTLYMDSSGKIFDSYRAKDDLKNKVIKCVGDPNKKFYEDSLRILRAIRFATILDFKLDDSVKEAIYQNKYLIKQLSFDRKRQELDKIFTFKNVKYGVQLLLEFGLDEELELYNLSKITYFENILGIWALLDNDKYPFSKNEKDIIKNIKMCLKEPELDNYTIYQYGLYVSQIVGGIREESIKKITKLYNKLPIKNVKDIDIKGDEILSLINCEPSSIGKIYKDLEKVILKQSIKNKNVILKKYIVEHYKKC